MFILQLQRRLAARVQVQIALWRQLSSQSSDTKDDESTSLAHYELFSYRKEKTKSAFIDALTVFEQDPKRRGHVEFIYAALKKAEEYGVHRDLEVYKKILDLFPKGKMVPTNIFQAEFMHYPKQQQCAIDVLEQMEDYGVIPDVEMQRILVNTFGKRGHPVRKHMRMLYWMPKFKNLSPWLLPDDLTNDSLELAKIAIERITSVDLETRVDVYQAKDLADSIDNTWIVSGQSRLQRQLISELPKNQAIYVEGAFTVWLRRTAVNYFILRADPPPHKVVEEDDPDDVKNMKFIFFDFGKRQKKELVRHSCVHEQTDGTILSCSATGTSSRDSLLSWIRFLEKSNPAISDIPVLFKMTSPLGSVVPVKETTDSSAVSR